MKFEIQRGNLEIVLNIIEPITRLNDIRQITNSVMLLIKDNKLYISATNEEMFIKTIIDIEYQDEPFSILLDSKALTTISNTNDVEKLLLSSPSTKEDLESGNGYLEIIGNSKYTLPVRSLLSFPEFPNLDSLIFSPIDKDSLIFELNLLQRFIDKDSLGYERGVCLTGKRILSTDHHRGVVLKKIFPTEPITIIPSIYRQLSEVDELSIAILETPKMAIFKGIIKKINFEIIFGVYQIEEKCPYEKILGIINDWVNSDGVNIEVDNKTLAKTINRMKGFIFDSPGIINVEIKDKQMNLSYKYNQYESTSIVDCISSENTSFGISIRDFEDVVNLGEDIIKFKIHKTKPILLMIRENMLHFLSLYQI